MILANLLKLILDGNNTFMYICTFCTCHNLSKVGKWSPWVCCLLNAGKYHTCDYLLITFGYCNTVSYLKCLCLYGYKAALAFM